MLDFRSYGAATAPHAHDFVQVVLPSRGVLEMEVDGRGGRVDRQHVAVIPPGAVHTFGATGDNRFIVLDAVETPNLSGLGHRVFVELTPGLRGLTMWLQAAPDTAISTTLAEAWSSLALAALADHPANQPARRPRPDPRIERVWAAIDRRFAESLTVDELAAEVGLSGRRLAALFRAGYGTTFHARLAQVRLQHAVRWLETTTLPIAEVATRAGYYDQSALNRQVKASLGTTPAALRRDRRA